MIINPTIQPTPKKSAAKVTVQPFEHVRAEVITSERRWALIEAAIKGEEAVKCLGELILPRPNPTDKTKENLLRYEQYLHRASYYNVPGRTLDGMVGYVFASTPVVTLPDTLASLENNIDGAGVALVQQAKEALTHIIGLGRCGLLVDFPDTTEAVSVEDVKSGKIAPTVVLYHPSCIINWQVERVGTQSVLTMLVLRERYVCLAEDGFNQLYGYRFRTFQLIDGVVTAKVYERAGEHSSVEPIATFTPKDKSGNPLTLIPFVCIGSLNNNFDIDTPPLLDLVNLSFAHFRNSADYEESCFITGQPTIAISGLSEDWVKNVMNGKVTFGSRSAILLPLNGSAELLQAQENSMPKEAMELKEKQMVALGARLVEAKQVARTATEVGFDKASEVSTLTACANNVLLAYRQALLYCGLFVSADQAQLTFELGEPLAHDAFDPNEAAALILLWNAELVAFDEIRGRLKRLGLASDTPEDPSDTADSEEAMETAAIALRDAVNKKATSIPPPPVAPGAAPKKQPLPGGK